MPDELGSNVVSLASQRPAKSLSQRAHDSARKRIHQPWRMLARLAEIHRVAEARRGHGVPLDTDAFVFLIAATMNAFPPNIYRRPQKQTYLDWPGLTFASLRLELLKADYGAVSDADIVRKIRAVERHAAHKGRGLMSQQAAGNAIGLTIHEKRACNVKTMHPADESSDERDARIAGERREAEAARKRDERRAAGMMSRDAYLANALSKREPWKTYGISRRQWERRQAGMKDVASLSEKSSKKAGQTCDISRSQTIEIANEKPNVASLSASPIVYIGNDSAPIPASGEGSARPRRMRRAAPRSSQQLTLFEDAPPPPPSQAPPPGRGRPQGRADPPPVPDLFGLGST